MVERGATNQGGTRRWVLLAYHLPREPSTPRITLWRKLKRLGTVQVLDGLVGLPHTARTQEQLEWLADEVIEAGGDASVWAAEPLSAALQRDLADRATAVVSAEYHAIATAAQAAAAEPETVRRRTLARLRRDLHRIDERDYFAAPEHAAAHTAVEALAAHLEVSTCSG